MRYPFITILSLLIFCGICTWSYIALTAYSPTDVEEYEALVKSTDPSKSEDKSQSYTSTQQHRSTHKDIWFTQGGQRLQLRLRSQGTQLVLEHQENKTQIVEHMKGVTCCIQEELYYVLEDGREVRRKTDGSLVSRQHNPKDVESIVDAGNSTLKPMQVIRYLEADVASYYYQTDRFTAEQVHVSRIVIPGHELIESIKDYKPIMTGLARSVEFALVGNELNFTAYQLKATLYQPQEIATHATGRES